jgi:hypothetical protein
LPLRRNLLFNSALTATLLYSMWLVANRREFINSARIYWTDLSTSYSQGKYAYLSRRYEDS